MSQRFVLQAKLGIAGIFVTMCGAACVAETGVPEDELGVSETSEEALINSNQGPHREGDCVASTNPNGCIDCWAQRDESCHECTGNSSDMFCCRVGDCEILNKPSKLNVIGISGALKDLGTAVSAQP